MTAKQLAARQARSRDTEARIFRATSRVLEERGLEGTTIPRIAKAAGVAAGSVYRRFKDKDALLRAVFLGRLETSAIMQGQMGSIADDWLGKYTLEGAVEAVIHGLVSGYRMRHRLVRATLLYMETQADEAFRRRASALDALMHQAMKQVILKHRDRIGHPDPERAVAFAMTQLGATLMSVIGLQSTGQWVKSLPMSDDELKRELARSFLAYLQVQRAN